MHSCEKREISTPKICEVGDIDLRSPYGGQEIWSRQRYTNENLPSPYKNEVCLNFYSPLPEVGGNPSVFLRSQTPVKINEDLKQYNNEILAYKKSSTTLAPVKSENSVILPSAQAQRRATRPKTHLGAKHVFRGRKLSKGSPFKNQILKRVIMKSILKRKKASQSVEGQKSGKKTAAMTQKQILKRFFYTHKRKRLQASQDIDQNKDLQVPNSGSKEYYKKFKVNMAGLREFSKGIQPFRQFKECSSLKSEFTQSQGTYQRIIFKKNHSRTISRNRKVQLKM